MSQIKPWPTVAQEIQEAALLAERFPDLPDVDVMEHVALVVGGDPINPKSPVGLCVMQAYVGGIESARRFSLAMFGSDWTET